MLKAVLLTLAPLLIATAAVAGPDSAPAGSPIVGVWANPKHAVEVRIVMCGEDLCGRVVAATTQARQDAQKGGTDNLIGTELLHNFHSTAPRQWSGILFVPDMGQHYSSRLVALSPTKMRISGCVLGGLICKSQEWTRE